MSRMIFVNLPVKDLERLKAFYEAIGFRNEPKFTNDAAAMMVLSDTIHVMLLTHDKYKQFTSKEDLAAQASKRALESASNRWSAAAAANPKDPLSAVVAIFLSTDHRAERMDGCPIVALGSDAARQGSDVKASFEAGIREYLELLDRWVGEADGEEPSGKAMAILSTMVGAVVLSRAVNDKRLSKQLLQAAAKSVMGLSAGAAPKGQRR